jgi:hypothetical protein
MQGHKTTQAGLVWRLSLGPKTAIIHVLPIKWKKISLCATPTFVQSIPSWDLSQHQAMADRCYPPFPQPMSLLLCPLGSTESKILINFKTRAQLELSILEVKITQ